MGPSVAKVFVMLRVAVVVGGVLPPPVNRFSLPLDPNPIGPHISSDALNESWTADAAFRSDSAAISVGAVTIIAGGWDERNNDPLTRKKSADLLIFNGSSSFDLYYLPEFFTEPRTDMAVASAGRSIVFAGGSTASNINDDKLYCYNVDSRNSSATQCGQLIVGRRGMGAAGAGDLVLFVGGWSQTAADDFTTPLTVYSDIDAVNTTSYLPISASNNKWHLQTGDPRISSGDFDARAGVAACTVRDRFVVFGGGYDGVAFSNSVFVFDINDWRFKETSDMSHSVWYAAAACTGDVAVFAGGATDIILTTSMDYIDKPCYDSASGCDHSHMITVVKIVNGEATRVVADPGSIIVSQFGRGISIGSSVFFRFARDFGWSDNSSVFGHPNVVSSINTAFVDLCVNNPWVGCPNFDASGDADFFFVANHIASVALSGGSGSFKGSSVPGKIAELTSYGSFGYNISGNSSGQFPITTDSLVNLTSTSGSTTTSSSSSSGSVSSTSATVSSPTSALTSLTSSSPSSAATTSALSLTSSSSDSNSYALLVGIIVALNVCIITSVVVASLFIRHRRHDPDRSNRTGGHIEMSSAVSRSSFGTMPATGKMAALTDVTLREQIGQGNFGAVWLAVWRGTPVACKALTGDVDISEIEAEAALLASLNHPNIVNLLGVFTDTSVTIANAPTFLVFKYADGGSVLDAVRRMSLPVDLTARQQQGAHLLRWMLDAARGMEYVASRGVVHRDLGCRNLLLSGDRVSVCDFGLSRMLPEGDTSYTLDAEKKRSTALPVRWCPKELLQQGTSSELSDSYSFGIVLWEAFSFGALPFTGRSNAEVVVSIIAGQTHQELAHPPGCPDEAYHLALQCWSMQPENRPRFTAIRTSLESILEKMPGELSSPQYSTSFLTSRSPGSKDPGSYRSPSTAGLEDYQSVDAAPGSPDYQSVT